MDHFVREGSVGIFEGLADISSSGQKDVRPVVGKKATFAGRGVLVVRDEAVK